MFINNNVGIIITGNIIESLML